MTHNAHFINRLTEVLGLLQERNESPAGLVNALECLMTFASTAQLPHPLIDIVGTGGDGLNTFNISTAASLVVASCGVPIAKHGGRSATSVSGSTDVVQCLGIKLADSFEDIRKSLDRYNYAYLSAPLFNPLFKVVSPLRKELGRPTLFNLLGPLANPLQPKRQVLGICRGDLLQTMAEVLRARGSVHSLVVHGNEGLDELSICGPTQVAELANGKISAYEICPEDLGLTRYPLQDIAGAGPKENAETIRGIFKGNIRGAKRDIVMLNAAAGLLVGGAVSSLREGVGMADCAIDSGRSIALLNNLTETKLHG